MVKPEWGTKRTCPKCGTRFYDLGNEDPVTCIECGNEWTPEPVLKSKQPIPFEEEEKKEKDDEVRAEWVRAQWRTETGRSPGFWAQLAEIGVPGLIVAEDHAGLGMDETDLALVLEEVGRVGLAEPIASTAYFKPFSPNSTLTQKFSPSAIYSDGRFLSRSRALAP